MFKTFWDLTQEVGIPLEDFLIKDRRIPKPKREILLKVKELHNWKGTIYVLANRIKKIMKTSKFTARDIRLLKRLLREESWGMITIDQVHDNFPGKSLSQILSFRSEYF